MSLALQNPFDVTLVHLGSSVPMVAAPVDISQWHLANGKTWRRSLWLLHGLQDLGDTELAVRYPEML